MKEEDSKIEEYRDRLSVYNISALAERLNMPYRSLNDFARGKTMRPNAEIYEKLQNFFEVKK